MNRKFKIVFFMVSIVLMLNTSCSQRDALEKIKKTGAITVLTRNNAHCYYLYRDTPMGFEYDLAREFAKYLGVELNIVTPRWENLAESLNNNEGDFIAASMTITPSRQNQVDFSEGYLDIQQQVIVHKNNYLIDDTEDLEGRTIHVRQGTSYEERLLELKNQGSDITIVLHDDVPTEELIRMVAEKEIDITVADSNVALLNRRYYPDVKIAFAIAEPQSLGWAVKKDEKKLLNEINDFFKKMEEKHRFADIYRKYYSGVEIFDYFDLKKYHQRLKTRLPKYQAIIQEASRNHGFDWRFISAVIYQESHLDPRAVSHTGVRGIMQLTQSTAKEMGVRNRLDPAQSIRGGVKYLKKLYARHEDIKGFDRMLLTLASYNVGYGHVRDAQKIAREKGLNPHRWSSLEKTLPMLRYPKYYKNSDYGYCRGTEPVRYVKRILTYYDILKRGGITSIEVKQAARPGSESKEKVAVR
jgi:peptidoglycan lytic transglycosylase F